MNENWDEIDQYIMEALDAEAQRQFEKRLAAEPSLQQEVQLRLAMKNSAEVYGRQALKEKLKSIHREVIGEPEPSRSALRLWPYLAAAATALFLIAAFFLLKNPSAPASPEALYAEYFNPYAINSMQRSDNAEQVLLMEQYYGDGDYAAALPLLETLLTQTDPQPSLWLLAAGICQLELKRPEAAISYFAQISANQDFNFQDQASWYTALAYLQQNDLPAARVALQPLVNNLRADHYEEAKKLLDKLDN